MRLVLMGPLNEGKKSIGDTILGRDMFSQYKTDLETKQGWVAGKPVTVIDTPGWGREHSLSQTPGSLKEKLMQSVFPPGVHALLLVIRADKTFTEANRVSVQEHMELLGERVWDHTVVLFTRVQWCNTPIEQFIYGEGRALQWVVERASHKYYCINISDRADNTQVTKLLGLIEMMAAHQGYFELDKETYERQIQQEKAREAAIEAMQQRSWGIMSKWTAQPPAMRRTSMPMNPPNYEELRSDSRNNPPLSKFHTSFNNTLSYKQITIKDDF